jgi:two-component system response regulator HydG
VVNVTVPALRHRREDIALLADYFLKKYVEKNRRSIKGFAPKAMDWLLRYSWPGNVRELENAVERAVIMERGDLITLSELPDTIQNVAENPEKTDITLRPGKTLKEVEREMILQSLDQNSGNRTQTAKILGISRRTLQLKLKEYGSAH